MFDRIILCFSIIYRNDSFSLYFLKRKFLQNILYVILYCYSVIVVLTCLKIEYFDFIEMFLSLVAIKQFHCRRCYGALITRRNYFSSRV